MTATQARPKTRTLTWTPNADDRTPTAGLLTVTAGDGATVYVVCEFSAGTPARGFTLAKPVGGGAYTTFVCRRGAGGDSCDCPAGVYRGRARKPCRHAAGLRKLIEIGKL